LVLPPRDVTRVGLYRDAGDGWEYIGDRRDEGGLGGSTRHLGRFALFRDAVAPGIRLLAVPRTPRPGPYPRWALEAQVIERGSGVDAHATHFVVDGHRVPSEWDSVIGVLRWKPLRAPSSGEHTVTVVATDRAGNTRQTSARFVVD
jgi:hypothetical protein